MIFPQPRDRSLVDCDTTIARRSLHARPSFAISCFVQQRHHLDVSGLDHRACPYVMPSTCRAQSTASTCSFGLHSALWISLVLLFLWAGIAHGMTDGEIQGLRYEAILSANGRGRGS